METRPLLLEYERAPRGLDRLREALARTLVGAARLFSLWLSAMFVMFMMAGSAPVGSFYHTLIMLSFTALALTSLAMPLAYAHGLRKVVQIDPARRLLRVTSRGPLTGLSRDWFDDADWLALDPDARIDLDGRGAGRHVGVLRATVRRIGERDAGRIEVALTNVIDMSHTEAIGSLAELEDFARRLELRPPALAEAAALAAERDAAVVPARHDDPEVERVAARLRLAEISMAPRPFAMLSMAVGIACGLALHGFLGFFLGLVLPFTWVRLRMMQRREAHAARIESATAALSRRLEAGQDLAGAMEEVARRSPGAVGDELALFAARLRAGQPLAACCRELAARFPAPAMFWLSRALRIQQSSGGRLVELRDGLARSLPLALDEDEVMAFEHRAPSLSDGFEIETSPGFAHGTVLSCLAGLVVGGVLHGTVAGMLAYAVLAFATTRAWLHRAQREREKMLARQLPDALTELEERVAGGASVPQALAGLAADAPAPLASDVDRIVQETELGFSLEEALAHFKERAPLEVVARFADLVRDRAYRGGRLADHLAASDR